eukprot:jgi/Tetstr1/460155/TSEL_005471.t1
MVLIHFQQAWAEAQRCVNERVVVLMVERRMLTELVRSWDDACTEALYAGHVHKRLADDDLFAALLVCAAWAPRTP